MTVYKPGRDHRFDHALDVVGHIEERCCSLGCKRGLINGTFLPEMPGGSCDLLMAIGLEQADAIQGLDDDGTNVTCLVREPL